MTSDQIAVTGRASYCPESNKLHLYVGRVPRPEYDALRAEGWTSTPKQSEAGQGEFAATWTPQREDTALAYSEGYIEDEDAGPGERAADRAERFGGYLEKRTAEAGGYADDYDGQDAAHGFQNADRAERAAARHDRLADRACGQWSKAEYWQRRTAGVISHALYKDTPGVRMGRIKILESEKRKQDKSAELYAKLHAAWMKTAATEDAADADKRAYALANSGHCWSEYPHPYPDKCEEYHRKGKHSLYTLLTDEKNPITGSMAAALWLSDHAAPAVGGGRWANHYALRLAYERQMLEAQGGTLESNLTDIEPGGWLGKRQVQSVHKSNATGRVSSVKVWGTTGRLYTKESNYTKQEDRPCLCTLHVERLLPGSYRAPTDEERAAFLAGKKAAKEERGTIPTINPTRADAERLQAQMNAESAEATKGHNYPKKPGAIEEMTQAHFSAMDKDYRTLREYRGVKIRVCVHGWQNVESVVVLTDKPQKAFPASVWYADDPESRLRAKWTADGVSPEKQNAIIAEVAAKAQRKATT